MEANEDKALQKAHAAERKVDKEIAKLQKELDKNLGKKKRSCKLDDKVLDLSARIKGKRRQIA